MPTLEIVKAWKDEEYRDTLTNEELAESPEHPSGRMDTCQEANLEKHSFQSVPLGCNAFTKGFTIFCCNKNSKNLLW